MYAPCAFSSFASAGSTSVILPVTFLALSRGTSAPHWLQCTVPELPLPPLDRPRLALFFGMNVDAPCHTLNLVLCRGRKMVHLSVRIMRKAYSLMRPIIARRAAPGRPAIPKRTPRRGNALFLFMNTE